MLTPCSVCFDQRELARLRVKREVPDGVGLLPGAVEVPPVRGEMERARRRVHRRGAAVLYAAARLVDGERRQGLMPAVGAKHPLAARMDDEACGSPALRVVGGERGDGLDRREGAGFRVVRVCGQQQVRGQGAQDKRGRVVLRAQAVTELSCSFEL